MNARVFASLVLASCLCATLVTSHSAGADQPPLRVGLISTFSGFFTQYGKDSDAAVAAFIKEHGDQVAGRKLEIIKRDDSGLAPENAKRLAQELVVNDHVDFLMGLMSSPNAKAVGDISTASKTPTIIVNAAGYGLLEPNPYMARLSYTEGQLTHPLAAWALKNNIKNVYLVYLDFSAGLDASSAFSTAFTAGGGTISGEVRVPTNAIDFSAYVQRVRDAKPQAVFTFLTGSFGPFMKAWRAAGGQQSGIKVLATGETNEQALPALGDDVLGVYTAMNYSAAHVSPLNAVLTRDMRAADSSIASPDFYSVATYDALQAIYKVTAQQNGTLDPDKTMALLKGIKLDSARGPVQIDRQTRDVVQNIYIRRVDKINGVYQNTEIAVYPTVKDPLEK